MTNKLVITLITVATVSAIVLFNINSRPKETIKDEDYYNRIGTIKTLAKEFSRLDNTMYNKENYNKHLDNIERITTNELFNQYYTEDGRHVLGMADTLGSYNFNIESIVVEEIRDGYNVMIYAKEVIEGRSYPYTSILVVSSDNLISSYIKIPHNFN